MSPWLLVVVLTCLLNEEPAEVVLGGPRKVVASIGSGHDDYLVRVRMSPVRCFDAAMNCRLNQEKAGLMARRALLAHLNGGGAKVTETIEVGRIQIVSSSLKDDLFEQTVRLPKAAVVLSVPERTPTPKTKVRRSQPESSGNVPEASLFTRKQDYADTLLSFCDASDEDLRGLRRESPTPSKSDPFYSRIADFEEAQVARLANLRKEVNADRLLLNLERQEILDDVDRRESKILHDLSEIVKSWDRDVKRPDKGFLE